MAVANRQEFVMRYFTAALAAAGAIGMAFTVLPADAQQYYGQPYPPAQYNYEGTTGGGPNEVVIVAPNFHAQTNRLNAPPEGVSISERVSYADLDLRTREGAQELRNRVGAAAARICGKLREVYPYTVNPHDPCFRAAMDNAMPKARAAIDDARITARRAYEDGYYGGYER
jgi:UrcA family protein